MDPVEYILDLLDTQGFRDYLGEPVSQREHALQTADLARRERASPSLVAAALLHDIGHLLPANEEPSLGEDALHEERAACWLSAYFGPEVTEPVRLHVAAKRYLCTVEPEYLSLLSAASLQSLKSQGGPFSADQVKAFEESPYHEGAVRLRRWDEEAKQAGLTMPSPRTYAVMLGQLLVRRQHLR